MDSKYTMAMEQRLSWLRWSNDQGQKMYSDLHLRRDLDLYQFSIERGQTFYMDGHFCDLVDLARRTVPDELEFEPTWMVTRSGWMWLEKPIAVPQIKASDAAGDMQVGIRAISWFTLEDHVGEVERITTQDSQPLKPGATMFLCWFRFRDAREDAKDGFGMWSFFVLNPGEKVLHRLKVYEERAIMQGDEGYYKNQVSSKYGTGDVDKLHEIRWIYTAMHLMSEKLAMHVQERADRALRRRFEKEKAPLDTFLRVVTLRRMQVKTVAAGGSVDWQYQWPVIGHWRRQWYPTEQVHKMKWIEDYVKGPPDKPLKPATHTIFAAER